ncbi:LysE family translocator [Pseudoalteromonas sp. C2R02]|uniref:LysE family translocator n=1 Tax=Pseudoalteromonas sp. C2R02 TaxID=2841565 RepID=UPI001C088C80|nr:LysE family translocator [Pseudoalteromonas sp. C2R02]MBU2968684.1 LysE family translocator [Pseudoalteromonas sp. C2R02]
MNIEILTALATFAFVSSITPGPNNLMLMSSGANFGFKLTIPHMLGVSLGFVFMVCLVGAGLIQVFDIYPITYQVLKVFSVIYLVYLAYKIATSKPIEDHKPNNSKPFTFLQAAMFQWVNPKAWTMALTAISVYSPSKNMESILLVGIVFGAINLPSVGVWTVLGQQLKRFLTSDIKLRIFNITMALLLIASLYPMVI